MTASATSTTTATFTVSLSAPSDLPTTVSYATSDGTGLAGADYTAVSGTLTFNPGQTQQTVNVNVAVAPRYDVSKTFSVRLSAATGARIATGGDQAAGTINNPNPLPALSIAGATVTASATSSTTAMFIVSLSAPSDLATTVAYTTADATALAGVAYTAASGTLTFRPGTTEKTISVTVAAAPQLSASETFSVQLSAASNASFASGQSEAAGTINKPCSLPAFSISSAVVAASATSPTTAAFTVSLSAPSTLTTMVAYTTADVTALAGTDYTATSGTLTFTPGETEQTVVVTVDAAPRYDVSKTFSVQLAAASNATITSGQGQATGTINNPNVLPALAISSATVTASATSTTLATFIVRLSALSNQTTTVNYITADGTAARTVLTTPRPRAR